MTLQLRINFVIFTALYLQGVVTFLPNLFPYRLQPLQARIAFDLNEEPTKGPYAFIIFEA